jgi:vacuolar-type H+-ATPase subunit H
MENVLKQIISVENKAKEIAASAQTEREKILAGARERCRGLEADIAARRDARLEKMRETETAALSEKRARITADGEAARARVESAFNEHKARWADEIFQNVTGG